MEQHEWTVEFRWIKAHAGQRGNEMADQQAEEAAKNQEHRGMLHQNTKDCCDE